MRIPRLQLLELEDQSWFPAVVRDLATDYLRFVEHRLGLYRHALPVLERVIEASGAERIVDLCSGGAGPVPVLATELRQRGRGVRFTLTDLFPNLPAFRDAGRDASIDYIETPVDARSVPVELSGIRTFFNAFHHFAPDDAEQILRAAAQARQPVAVLELPDRRIGTIVPILFTPLFVWVATLMMRPFTWKRFLLTYLVPAVPFTCWWDGVVSMLRAYRPEELLDMARGAAPTGYHWEVGTHRESSALGRVTYLIGWPVPGGGGA